LAALRPDVLVVVAFGHILKPSTLALARAGALNVHASLLPRWRGAAPIERAIAAGDDTTGVSLMQLDAGMDTGPVVAQRAVAITPSDTRVTLRARLADLGAALLGEELATYLVGERTPEPQDEARATYAPRLRKDEGRVDWDRDARSLWLQVRAFAEWPSCTTSLRGVPMKLHAVRLLDRAAAATPGTIVQADADAVWVACGTGTLQLDCVQLAGKPRVAARDLVSGRVLRLGDRLGT
jgi:methionyl-tRNA formyltransferase